MSWDEKWKLATSNNVQLLALFVDRFEARNQQPRGNEKKVGKYLQRQIVFKKNLVQQVCI